MVRVNHKNRDGPSKDPCGTYHCPVERFPLNLCHCIQATPFPFAATGLGEGCNLGIGIPHEQYSIPKQARLY